MRRTNDEANSHALTSNPPRRIHTRGRILPAMAIFLIAMPSRSVLAQTLTTGGPANPSIGEQVSPPDVLAPVRPHAGAPYESSPILSLPKMFVRQWTPSYVGLPHDEFRSAEDNQSIKLSLKETIYLALR